MWAVAEMTNPFVDNWHIGAVAEHLEACTFGEIRNLIINIPPGALKSLSVCVFWPTWEWSFQPSIQWMFGSYAHELALRDSKKCRRLIESEEYQRDFGELTLLQDDNNASKFVNDKGGHRLATSVGGQGTGERADRIVADDPTKMQDADAPLALETAGQWWFETLGNRDRDLSTCVRVIVMQRLAKKDLTGLCLERNLGYELLKLPMEYDPKATVTQSRIEFSDPRKEPNELLFPARVPASEMPALKARLGSYGVASQLQQEPQAREGSAVKRSWYEPFVVHFDLKEIKSIFLYYDIGFSNNAEADFTWGSLKCKMKDGSFLTIWQHFGRWNSSDRNRHLKEFGLTLRKMSDDGVIPPVTIMLEAGIGGSVEVVRECLHVLIAAGLTISAKASKGSKVTRATATRDSYFAACEAGRTRFYVGDAFKAYGLSNGLERWVNPYLNEVTQLRYNTTREGMIEFVGAKDDPLDAETGAHNWLVRTAGAVASSQEQVIFF